MKDILQPLLTKRWILKKEDPELYYQIKDRNKEISRFMNDKFGYNLIIHPSLIKLEKIPSIPEEWMGIQDFKDIKDYQMFCYILMFLEDKEEEYQFLLSQICEYIQLQFQQEEVDWNTLKNRRQLVRALQYATKIGLIAINDGQEDGFVKNQGSEVLYENLGISRYYMRNFVYDINKFQNIRDFQGSIFTNADKEKGILRRWHVYRNLLLSLGLYREHNEAAYDYVMRYRNNIEQDFQTLFACDLQVYGSCAYLVVSEDETIGKVFPANRAMDDLVMLTCQDLRKRVSKHQLKTDTNEMLEIPTIQFSHMLVKLIKDNSIYLPKKYKGELMSEQSLAKDIIDLMIYDGIAYEKDGIVHIYPLVGKIEGDYQE